ncbi:uncharacterized protein LOC105840991 [Monomorium pharaonis]|uniref:uncharacterized protein LOC105840991 n=1 Tax=Monomorium pharaonis TaxID=307658 RepID=UPI00063F95A2|nr:uncharacterized protein LOC105840991 [Monomorium pharaonis]XP_036140754.1 uncharacterized protein LOC105840991 [Monomorium pharaonis]XP_036140755.1 uncharacterized protein LOC105840991 [Monomorium pharaonis]
MAFRCYLCDRKPSKNENISVHRFPKDPILRQKWKDVCGLTEIDDVTHVYICSVHFIPENVRITKGILGKPRIGLKPGSVPTISVPIPAQFEIVLTSDNKENETSENVETDASLLSTDCTSVPIKDVEYMDDVNDDINSLNHVNYNHIAHDHDYCNENYISAPKKRRFHERRFISEVTLSDFSLPERAEQTLKFIKDKDQQQAQKIKHLQDIIRYQRKRIVSLRAIVKYLKTV